MTDLRDLVYKPYEYGRLEEALSLLREVVAAGELASASSDLAGVFARRLDAANGLIRARDSVGVLEDYQILTPKRMVSDQSAFQVIHASADETAAAVRKHLFSHAPKQGVGHAQLLSVFAVCLFAAQFEQMQLLGQRKDYKAWALEALPRLSSTDHLNAWNSGRADALYLGFIEQEGHKLELKPYGDNFLLLWKALPKWAVGSAKMFQVSDLQTYGAQAGGEPAPAAEAPTTAPGRIAGDWPAPAGQAGAPTAQPADSRRRPPASAPAQPTPEPASPAPQTQPGEQAPDSRRRPPSTSVPAVAPITTQPAAPQPAVVQPAAPQPAAPQPAAPQPAAAQPVAPAAATAPVDIPATPAAQPAPQVPPVAAASPTPPQAARPAAATPAQPPGQPMDTKAALKDRLKREARGEAVAPQPAAPAVAPAPAQVQQKAATPAAATTPAADAAPPTGLAGMLLGRSVPLGAFLIALLGTIPVVVYAQMMQGGEQVKPAVDVGIMVLYLYEAWAVLLLFQMARKEGPFFYYALLLMGGLLVHIKLMGGVTLGQPLALEKMQTEHWILYLRLIHASWMLWVFSLAVLAARMARYPLGALLIGLLVAVQGVELYGAWSGQHMLYSMGLGFWGGIFLFPLLALESISANPEEFGDPREPGMITRMLAGKTKTAE